MDSRDQTHDLNECTMERNASGQWRIAEHMRVIMALSSSLGLEMLLNVVFEFFDLVVLRRWQGAQWGSSTSDASIDHPAPADDAALNRSIQTAR